MDRWVWYIVVLLRGAKETRDRELWTECNAMLVVFELLESTLIHWVPVGF